jgi:hypothetical protein
VAIDAAGNVQPSPASYTWAVNVEPPQTTIDGKPASRISTRSATFTYHANRPDTVFECSMDGEGFSSCPKTGSTYTELADGQHTFRVRAIDSDGDVEGSPPSYSFTVGPPPPNCAKGFRRKVVQGAFRCVKIRHHRHHRRHGKRHLH